MIRTGKIFHGNLEEGDAMESERDLVTFVHLDCGVLLRNDKVRQKNLNFLN